MSYLIDYITEFIESMREGQQLERETWEQALDSVYGRDSCASSAQDRPGAHASTRTVEGLILVYRDEHGATYEQPLGDITCSGTLIDPENGEDLELLGWKQRTQWRNALPEAIAECLTDREEPEAQLAVSWLRGHEDDDTVWSAINRLFDELIDLSTR